METTVKQTTRLSESDVDDIVEKYNNGMKQKDLANKYQVPIGTIKRIIHEQQYMDTNMIAKILKDTDKSKKFDIVVKRCIGNDGITSRFANDALMRLKTKKAHPVDFLAKDVEESAIGFITTKLADTLGFDYEATGLHDFINNRFTFAEVSSSVLGDYASPYDISQFAYDGKQYDVLFIISQ